MKIGIVTNLYPPYARGGAEQVVVRTVEELSEMHHDVFVITSGPKRKGKIVDKDPTATERIYRFYPRNIYFILDDYKYFWFIRLFWHIMDAFSSFSARHVAEVVQDENPDVMVTHNLKGIGLRIPRAIQRAGVPHVHVVHDLQLIYPSGLLYSGKEKISLFVKPFYAVYQAICRHRMGKPDLVIFPSNYLKEMYMRHGFFKNSDVRVMPNPAPRFTPEERTGRRAGPLRLLFVGQLEWHKGITFLLEEFQKLEIDAQLIIAGEGTYAAAVNKAASKDKRIIYLGFISLEQLVNCFGIADAVIVPSLCYENSPTVIYESLTAGVPVIASNIGGVGELVEDGKNGFLFKPGSKSGFVRALWRLDEKKEEFAKRQKEIQQTVAPYALSTYARQFVSVLEKVKTGKMAA